MKRGLNKILLLMAFLSIAHSAGFAAQTPAQSYEPGVIIYKLKNPATLSSLNTRDFFVQSKKALAQSSSAKISSSTPKFLSKFPGSKLEKVFGNDQVAVLKPRDANPKVAKVKDTGNLLKNIYQVNLRNEKDLERALVECEKDPAIEFCQRSFIYEDMSFPIDQNPNDLYYNQEDRKAQFDFHNINISSWSKSMGEGVLVGIVDGASRPDHEDLEENVWINAGEFPCKDWNKNGSQVCVDVNQDGKVTVAELATAGLGDTNGDGFVNVHDLYGSKFQDGINNDGNIGDGTSYVDDFFGWNFYENTNNTTGPHKSHGMLVAGLVAGIGNNEKGAIGVAPKANVMLVQASGYNVNTRQVLSRSTRTEANAIMYAVDNGAKIINYSRGSRNANNDTDNVFKEVVDYVLANNAVFVAAAGNYSTTGEDSSSFSPGKMDKVISAGALASNGFRLNTSVYGPKVTVWAMADNLLSTGREFRDSYGGLSETSAASPVVAGAVALLMSKNIKEVPDEDSPRRIKASEYKGLIQKTCRKTGVIDHGVEICAIDALALVNVAAPVLSPITAQTARIGQVTQFELTAIESNPADRVTGIKALRTTLPDGTVIESLPEGAVLTTVNPAQATFRWTPSLSMTDGEYKIEFQADNTMGLKDIQTAAITIAPPVVAGYATLSVSNAHFSNASRESNYFYVGDLVAMSLTITNTGNRPSAQTAMEVCMSRASSVRVLNDRNCTTVTVPSLYPGVNYFWSNTYWPMSAGTVEGRNYITINPDVLQAININNRSVPANIPPRPLFSFSFETYRVPQPAGSQAIEGVRQLGTLYISPQPAAPVPGRVFNENRGSSSEITPPAAITAPVVRPNPTIRPPLVGRSVITIRQTRADNASMPTRSRIVTTSLN